MHELLQILEGDAHIAVTTNCLEDLLYNLGWRVDVRSYSLLKSRIMLLRSKSESQVSERPKRKGAEVEIEKLVPNRIFHGDSK